MEHKTIVDNPRESIRATFYSSDGFLIVQITKGSFPDWPTRNTITMSHADAQQLASFIQKCILEL